MEHCIILKTGNAKLNVKAIMMVFYKMYFRQ